MPPFMMDARRYRDALEQVDYVMRMEPSIPLHWRRAEALCALGDYEKAIEAERDQRLSAGQSRDGVERQLQPLRTAFAADGRRGYWRWKLDELQRNKESLYYQARANAQIGDFPKAIECLRLCLETTPFDLAFGIAGDWALDPLRSRPDFKALLKEMHLE